MAKGFVLLPMEVNSPTPTNGHLIQNGILSIVNDSYILGGSTTLQSFYHFKAFYNGSLNYYVVTFKMTNTSYIYTTSGKTATSSATSNEISIVGSYYDVSYKYGAYSILSFCANTLTAYDPYDSRDEALADILSETYSTVQYISGASAVAGPRLVVNGSTVTAYVTSPNGITVTDSDISITKNGVTVPFTYSDGVLTFTA